MKKECIEFLGKKKTIRPDVNISSQKIGKGDFSGFNDVKDVPKGTSGNLKKSEL